MHADIHEGLHHSQDLNDLLQTGSVMRICQKVAFNKLHKSLDLGLVSLQFLLTKNSFTFCEICGMHLPNCSSIGAFYQLALEWDLLQCLRQATAINYAEVVHKATLINCINPVQHILAFFTCSHAHFIHTFIKFFFTTTFNSRILCKYMLFHVLN